MQVRGVHYSGEAPAANFLAQDIKIIPWDQDYLDTLTEEELEAYMSDEDLFATIQYSDIMPIEGWNFPLATNHRYLIYWGAAGIDFEQMKVQLAGNWFSTDESIGIVHNHTDTRVYVNATVFSQDETWEFDVGWKKWTEDSPEDYGTQLANETLASDEADIGAIDGLGKNVHNNDTEKMFYYLLDGKDRNNLDLLLEGARCYDECVDDAEELDIAFVFLWSNQEMWETLDLDYPADGEDVEIPNTAHVIYDCEVDQTLEYGTISIQGRLSFQNGNEDASEGEAFDCGSLELRAHNIFVQGGEFIIEG